MGIWAPSRPEGIPPIGAVLRNRSSSHLPSFAIFIADQASRQATETTKETADLFREARALLADVDVFVPKIPRAEATSLFASLRKFQSEQKKLEWASVRIIRDRNLFLVESALQVCLGLGYGGTPTEGYRLASNYCEHYDPRYGNCLNGPSRGRIEDIINFVLAVEVREENESN